MPHIRIESDKIVVFADTKEQAIRTIEASAVDYERGSGKCHKRRDIIGDGVYFFRHNKR